MKGIKIFVKKRKKKNVNMFVNDIEIFLKKGKTKSVNMVAYGVKISQKMKKKNKMDIEKIIVRCGKNKDRPMFLLDKCINLFCRDFCFS